VLFAQNLFCAGTVIRKEWNLKVSWCLSSFCSDIHLEALKKSVMVDSPGTSPIQIRCADISLYETCFCVMALCARSHNEENNSDI